MAYHMLVVLALALIASGASALSSNTTAPPPPSKLSLLKIGFIILLVSWLILAAAALFSLRIPRYSPTPASAPGGPKLVYAVISSLPLIGMRVSYSAASIFNGERHLSPSTGDLGYRVCLGFLPELGVVMIFVLVGLWTRDMRRVAKSEMEVEGQAGVELSGGRK